MKKRFIYVDLHGTIITFHARVWDEEHKMYDISDGEYIKMMMDMDHGDFSMLVAGYAPIEFGLDGSILFQEIGGS